MGRYRGFNYDKNKNNSNIINEIKYYDKIGNFEKALVLINEHLNNVPDDDYIIAYKGMVFSHLKRHEEAKEILEDLIEKGHIKTKRAKFFAYSRYAKVLYALHEIDKSIEFYKKVIEESDELELISRFELAKIYQEKNMTKEAIDILTINGFNNMYLNIKRAIIYLINDDCITALSELNKKEENTLRIEQKEIFDYRFMNQEKNYIIGHSYFKLGKYNKAIPYLRESLDIKNKITYFKAYLDIAKIYVTWNRNEEVITICEELLKNSTSDTLNKNINMVLSNALLKKQDYEKAKEHLNMNIFDEKENKINIGKIELLKGNFEKAEENFNILNEETDDVYNNVDVFYFKMLTKFRLGKYDETLNLIDILEENGEPLRINKIRYRFNRIKLFIHIKKGEKIVNRDYSYSEKQIISYDKDRALEHIISHHINNIKLSKFKNVDQIQEIFNNVDNLLTDENVIYDTCFDKYIVKYNGIGMDIDDNNINQLMVITLPGTKNIITMYPVDGSESIFIHDEYEEKEKKVVKRLTQIEKFNKRYNSAQKI